jgi:hypothetical protein
MRSGCNAQRFDEPEDGPGLWLASALQGLRHLSLRTISVLSGVPAGIVARARSGRKVRANEYVLLCAVAGIDSATGAPADRTSLAGFAVEWWLVAGTTFLTRRAQQIDLRTAAIAAGVSVATMSRAESGRPLAVGSLLSISRFVGLPPTAFMRFTGNTNCNALISAVNFEAAVPPLPTRADAR